MTFIILNRMRDDWTVVGTSQASVEALRALANAESSVADVGAGNLAELLAALSDRSNRLTSEEMAAVIAAMLRSASLDPLIGRGLVQALMPALIVMMRRFMWKAVVHDSAEVLATDIVTTAWEIVTEWSGEDRPWALRDLLSAIRQRVSRQLERERRVDAYRSTQDIDQVPAPPDRNTFDELVAMIRSLPDGYLDEQDTAVLYGSLIGYSQMELAQSTGETESRIDYRVKRALRRLAVYA